LECVFACLLVNLLPSRMEGVSTLGISLCSTGGLTHTSRREFEFNQFHLAAKSLKVWGKILCKPWVKTGQQENPLLAHLITIPTPS
jgi:hypothetical protein